MRRSTDFGSVVRGGRRVRSGELVVHQRLDLSLSRPGVSRLEGGEQSGGERGDEPPLVGLVVGKSVGGSVVRHRVSRRLRAQLALRLASLPGGSGTVVRALPASAEASSAELGRSLSKALERLAARP